MKVGTSKDTVLSANIVLFLLSYLPAVIYNYSWLTRHIVHQFTDAFIILTSMLGFFLIWLFRRKKVFIPIKVIFSIVVSASICFLFLSVCYADWGTINLSKHDLKALLATPLVLFFALGQFIFFPIMTILYLVYFIMYRTENFQK